MFRIISATILMAAVAMNVMRVTGAKRWVVSVGLLALGLVLYLLSGFLIGRFIERRAPDLALTEEAVTGVQMWELTAGTGIVPRWVSWLGILAFGAALAAVVPWVVALFR